MKTYGIVVGAAGVAALALTASAETWTWNGTKADASNHFLWEYPENWLDSAGQASGTPQYGDTVIMGSSNTKQAYAPNTYGSVGGDGSAKYALYELRFPGPNVPQTNQGAFHLLSGGLGLQYLAGKDSPNDYSGMTLAGDGEVTINIATPYTFLLQKYVRCYADKDGKKGATLVKTGPGRFVMCCDGGGNATYYQPPLTLVRQGAMCFGVSSSYPISSILAFDGNDESQRIEFSNYRSATSFNITDMALKDAAIIETNGVANTAHGINCFWNRQIIFTGTPKVNPMVFSGTFYGGAGLQWNPSSAASVFVCSNAVSATTGRVDVVTGAVRLVTGASFTALESLSVGSGATFAVEDGSGANFRAGTLTLANDSVLAVSNGVTLTFHDGSLGGLALPSGRFTATGAPGTQAASWIVGDGEVVVETGVSGQAVWTGGGDDASVFTTANWLATPDLDSGESLGVFANGGTTAAIPSGRTVKFSGLYLKGGFAFTAGDGAVAEIGVNGLSSADLETSAAATYEMGWPLKPTAAQTWTVGANNALNLTAPLSGDGAVTVNGAGAVSLSVSSPDFTGALDFAAGEVRVTGDNALGTGSTPVRYRCDLAKMSFGSGSESRPISGYYVAANTDANTVAFDADSEITFKGLFQNNGHVTFAAGDGAKLHFDGGLATTTGGGDDPLTLKGRALFDCMKGRLMVGGSLTIPAGQKDVTVELGQPANGIAAVFWAKVHAGRINCHVTGAITNIAANARTQRLLLDTRDSVLDLGGCDQFLTSLGGPEEAGAGKLGGIITSDGPAILHLVSDNAEPTYFGGLERVVKIQFAGNAGISKEEGTGSTASNCPLILGDENTSTGLVRVVKGRLTFTETGTWKNASSVEVLGGQLQLQNADVFGTNTVVSISSGSETALDYAGTMEVAELRIDGRRRGGTWGAVGSGAQHETALITGTGFLHSDERGVMLLIR